MSFFGAFKLSSLGISLLVKPRVHSLESVKSTSLASPLRADEPPNTRHLVTQYYWPACKVGNGIIICIVNAA